MGMWRAELVVVTFYIVLCEYGGGNREATVLFTSAPPTIVPPTTTSVKLRCSIWDRHPGNAGDGESRCISPYLCADHRYLCFKCYLGDVPEAGYKRCKLSQVDSMDYTFKRGYRLLVRPGDVTYSHGLDPEVGGRSCTARVAVEQLGEGQLKFTMEFLGQDGRRLGNGDMTYVLQTRHPDDDVPLRGIQEVTSLTLRHRKHEMAMLMAGEPAQLLSNSTGLAVAGKLHPDQSERGYLELTWFYPNVYASGEYICDVTGIDTSGRNFVLSQTVGVATEDVSIEDLMGSMSRLQQDNLSLRTTCSRHLDLSQLKEEIGRLRTELQNLHQHVQGLEENMADLQHVESGYLDCGDSDSWYARDMDYKYRNVTVTFDREYSANPVVHLSVLSRTSAQKNGATYYATLVVTTSKSFTVACGTPINGGRVFNTMVQWISVPV